MAYILKIKYDGALRRVSVQCRMGTSEPDLTYSQLQSKIREIFEIPSSLNFSITYVDRDNDEVNIGDDQDIEDALVTQGLNPLRLDVFLKTQSNSNRSDGFEESRSLPADERSRSDSIDKYIQIKDVSSVKSPEVYPPTENSSFSQKNVESDTNYEQQTEDFSLPFTPHSLLNFSNDQTSSMNADSAMNFSPSLFSEDRNAVPDDILTDPVFALYSTESKKPETAFSEDSFNVERIFDASKNPEVSMAASQHPMLRNNSIHEGVTCDSCGMNPIVGSRFKSSRKYDFDLCGKCYNNIRDKDEYFEVNIHPQSKIVSPLASFQQSGRNSSSTSPFSIPNKISSATVKQTNLPIHEGVRCDVCGMLPIVGSRFNSSRKYDFDLCGNCYNNMRDKSEYSEVNAHPQSKIVSPQASFQHSGRSSDAIPFNLSHKISSATDKPGIAMASSGNPEFRSAAAAAAADRNLKGRLNSQVVRHVTVPDGTPFPAGTSFTKTWRLKNSGVYPWPAGTKLRRVAGDDLGSQVAVIAELRNGVPPESEVNASVDLVAPTRPGRYACHWRLMLPNEEKFGDLVWVLIKAY